MHNKRKTALLIVDLQNDFVPGGALVVPEGNAVVLVINRLLEANYDLKIATKDWHPPRHSSFASSHPAHAIGDVIEIDGIPQILWPDHCIQNSHGSEFISEFHSEKIQRIFYKGTAHHIDSYSAFFDNEHRQSTGLDVFLQQHEIQELHIAGLATDYCVKYSVLDALSLGFSVYVIADGCRGVNLNPTDSRNALKDMQQTGAQIILATEALKRIT